MQTRKPAEIVAAGLRVVERAGNRLPDPVVFFIGGILLVIALSHLAALQGWQVRELLPEVSVGEHGTESVEWTESGETFEARSLLHADGLYWILANLVRNFVEFPPLGVVLVAMLGIGLAERVGLINALLKRVVTVTPGALLTPAMVFLGIMSSLTLDAGYVLLVPLAGAIYQAVGRNPIAGIAATFAGVSAGFNANLLITGLDPMLAGFTEAAARTIDPDYRVNPACNWWFMIASTFVITLTAWAVSAFLVEKRLFPASGHGAAPSGEDFALGAVTDGERRALRRGLLAFAAVMTAVVVSISVEGFPLHGEGVRGFARWVDAIVPIIFFGTMVPALVYGISAGTITSDRDFARKLGESMAAMAPIIVLAFFAAQFIALFNYSGLDRMFAMAGGQMLARTEIPLALLILAFIAVVMVVNLFVGSMSAKYAMIAPIFIPMLMVVGISPELTQVAYRIGDSVTNAITPLNAYLVIILTFVRKYAPDSGLGTIFAAMLPYTIAFTIVWSLLLLLWMGMGWPLGPDGALFF